MEWTRSSFSVAIRGVLRGFPRLTADYNVPTPVLYGKREREEREKRGITLYCKSNKRMASSFLLTLENPDEWGKMESMLNACLREAKGTLGVCVCVLERERE